MTPEQYAALKRKVGGQRQPPPPQLRISPSAHAVLCVTLTVFGYDHASSCRSTSPARCL